ncbi:MAG: flagellar hook-associated protein FlgL [Desulfuromusa sp.]|nr:flagellar hook-associated protein FlgL [Desulfuromusa sp.]
MKVTQMSTYRSIQFNLDRTSDDLNQLYLQASNGKNLQRPSDDPASIGPILSSRTQIVTSDRYMDTIAGTQDGLNVLDGYLDATENLFVRAKEITVYGINGALSPEDSQALADEVAQLKTELFDIANANVDGKYIFSGYAENTPPFSGDPVVYQGTSDHKLVEISAGQTVQTNLSGDELFMSPINLFQTLADLETALNANDTNALNNSLTSIENASEQVRSQRSQMGNINAHLDDVNTMTAEFKLQMQEKLSRYEDADLAKVLSDMTQTEQAYEAALSVSARLSKLSILDYL